MECALMPNVKCSRGDTVHLSKLFSLPLEKMRREFDLDLSYGMLLLPNSTFSLPKSSSIPDRNGVTE